MFLITVKSNNLNGDVDLFTAGSLRPLMKFTLYAENSSPVTRAIFLRKREDLILRVEARSPNDDEGMYHIRLGGSFQPIAGDDPLAEAHNPTSDSATSATSRGTGSRRVSSVGARIAEPPVVKEEVATAPTPEPTPDRCGGTNCDSGSRGQYNRTPAPAPAPRRVRGRVPPSRRRPASPQPTEKNESSGSETTSEPRRPQKPPATQTVLHLPHGEQEGEAPSTVRPNRFRSRNRRLDRAW